MKSLTDKIAILGGGVTGLTAAYYLAKEGKQVTLFEKENTLGGLASGFKAPGWQWSLERHYHHLFTNDRDILDLAGEIGFDQIFFRTPNTASLYPHPPINQQLRQYPFNDIRDFFSFPLLSWPEKIRAGLVIGLLKMSPFLSLYEKFTAQTFLQKAMGQHAYHILWEELFRKKFGDYAGNILASFIWSRIKKRTRSLGYIKGGFQSFINFIAEKNKQLGVIIKTNHPVESIKQKGGRFFIAQEPFGIIISTLPTPILIKVTGSLFSDAYLKQLAQIQYLHSVNLILATEKPLLDDVYWLNVMVPTFPFVALVQHTNFIDKEYYDNTHLLYVGNYVKQDDPLLRLNRDEVLAYFLPSLQQINPQIKTLIRGCYFFRGPFAQPIFDKAFLKNRPTFTTPVKNFYLANLDMTYPHDRGSNYGVALSRKISRLILD